MENGSIEKSVSNYLKTGGKEHDKMNPTIRSKIIFGVASTMKKIHNNNAIHRDLKIDNIFLDDKLEPIIGGFEIAKFIRNDLDMTMVIGTPMCMAPETFMDGSDDYTISVDVYSYAFVLYKMFSNGIVFDGPRKLRSQQQYMLYILRGGRPKKPEGMPEHYWELIERCWKQDPLDRPTFDEIVEILKSDKYALEEFGMKTNLDELHEYQRRIESSGNPTKKSPEVSSKEENYFIGEEEERYHQVLSKIGEGATSVTYKVYDTKTDQLMCKKILKISGGNDSSSFKVMQNTMKEFEILHGIDYPCICKAIAYNTVEKVTDSNINTENSEDVTTIALFLEYEEYGLSDCLKTMNNTLKVRIVVEIAHAMNFIHKKGLIHRDLKIDNIRLNSVYEAKIIDFGLVRIHECFSDSYSFVAESMTKGVGTMAYMSPEMLNEEEYDYKTDVYSFGIVLYVMFVGSLPRFTMKEKMDGKIPRLPEPSQSISKCCIDIISRCLSYKPAERPSFDEILMCIRDNSYSLASYVNKKIIAKRDNELINFDKSI